MRLPRRTFTGRVVQVVVGFSAGGGYDLYARVLARHLGKHIPGNPSSWPQNMPGAGSLKAAITFTMWRPGRQVIGTSIAACRGAPVGARRAEFRATKIHLGRQRH